MKLEKSPLRRNFMLTELVMAMALLLLLSACFFASMRQLRQMDRSCSDDSAALLTVDNTLERLETKEHYNAEAVRKIFMDEYARSGLSERGLVKATVKEQPGALRLAMLRPSGKPLIEVNVKCRP